MNRKLFIIMAAALAFALSSCGSSNNVKEFTSASETENTESFAAETVNTETESAETFDYSILPQIPLDVDSVTYIKNGFIEGCDEDFTKRKIGPFYALIDNDNIYCFYMHDVMSTSERRCDIYRYTISDGSFELMLTIKDGNEFIMGQPVLTDNYVCWCRYICGDDVDIPIECIPKNGGEMRTVVNKSSYDEEKLPSFITMFDAKGDTISWEDNNGNICTLDIG